MDLDIPLIEKALLRGTWAGNDPDDAHPIIRLAQAVLQGKFRHVLTSPLVRDLFRVVSSAFDQPFDRVIALPTDDQGVEAEIARLILAVACLHAFVQVNWTGPGLDITPSEVISSFASPEPFPQPDEDFLNQKAVSELAFFGEPAYHLTKAAAFLRFAQVLLASPFKRCDSATWWQLRTTFVHQQVLGEPVPLPETLLQSLENSQALYSSEPDLEARFILERGLLQHQLSKGRVAAALFVKAARTSGLVYELTGVLGKRTRFQQFELSQLVLLAESRLAIQTDGAESGTHLPLSLSSQITQETSQSSNTAVERAENKIAIPETVALNDDTLLERTEFTSSHPFSRGSLLTHIDPSSQPPLHPLDQCILLSMCLNVRNTSPSHGLTDEQMSPYVERVICHPRNWSVHTMALLIRSRLESSRTRTVERSTLQLQALIEQMPTSDSSLQERLLYFHCLPLPSKWELERQLADRLIQLGVVKSALGIYERLEMWEEVVKCWGALERPEKGIEIVRDLLQGRKKEAEEVLAQGKTLPSDRRYVHDKARESKLWCLLGDLEASRSVEHYERAWMVSGEASGRAMRSLGGYYFARGQFSEAIASLKRAVNINPLFAKSWFILGCACMRVEDWGGARDAFSRCVTLDEEDGESWNNLASMYLRLGSIAPEEKPSENEGEDKVENGQGIAIRASIPFENKWLAYRALRQGLKFNYESWRMWYNYMIVAVDVGELAEACRALERVVEETANKAGVKAVDEDVLDHLVNGVTRIAANSGAAADEGGNGGANGAPAISPNEGHGLSTNVTNLFEKTILPRVSSPRIFRAYARLLTWQLRWEDALKAYMDAYRCSVAGTIHETNASGAGSGDAALVMWREGVREVEEIVDVLTNFGPRVDEEQVSGSGTGTGTGVGKKWRMQGRSIVRTFMGRSKDFEDEPEWERLVKLEEGLSK